MVPILKWGLSREKASAYDLRATEPKRRPKGNGFSLSLGADIEPRMTGDEKTGTHGRPRGARQQRCQLGEIGACSATRSTGSSATWPRGPPKAEQRTQLERERQPIRYQYDAVRALAEALGGGRRLRGNEARKGLSFEKVKETSSRHFLIVSLPGDRLSV